MAVIFEREISNSLFRNQTMVVSSHSSIQLPYQVFSVGKVVCCRAQSREDVAVLHSYESHQVSSSCTGQAGGFKLPLACL